MHRLRGTLWLRRVQVGLHGYEVLRTGHRLRGGRLGSRKCDGTGRFVQTVEGAVEVDGGEGSGKGGMGMRSRWCIFFFWIVLACRMARGTDQVFIHLLLRAVVQTSFGIRDLRYIKFHW